MNTISSFVNLVGGVAMISLFCSIFIVASTDKQNDQSYFKVLSIYTFGLTVVGVIGGYLLNTLFHLF